MAKTVFTMTKTVQVAQYEPLTITITEEHDKLLDDEGKAKRISKMGKSLVETMKREIKRWPKKDD